MFLRTSLGEYGGDPPREAAADVFRGTIGRHRGGERDAGGDARGHATKTGARRGTESALGDVVYAGERYSLIYYRTEGEPEPHEKFSP